MKQNFFDELDGGWGDIIADTYANSEPEIIKYNTNKIIEYTIKPLGQHLPDKIYTDEVTVRLTDINKIKVDIFKYYGDIVYGSIDPEYINAEYKEDDKIGVYNFENFASVGLFSFIVNDVAYTLDIHPLSPDCNYNYQGASLRNSITLRYNYNTKDFLIYIYNKIKETKNNEVTININPEFLNCIYNKIKDKENDREISKAFKILMDAYLEQR